MHLDDATRWARTVFALVGLLAFVVAILVAFGVDVETPGWNAGRIVALVLSLSSLTVMAVAWLHTKRKRRDNEQLDRHE